MLGARKKKKTATSRGRRTNATLKRAKKKPVPPIQPLPEREERFPLFEPSNPCPKCRNERVAVIYRRAIEDWVGVPPGKLLSRNAHMERNCGQCTYRWAERPADEAYDLELLAREAPKKKP
jgi:hypothetical protein